MNRPISQELAELVFLSLENEITPAQQERLETILRNDPLALREYFLLINVSIGVKNPNNLQLLHSADRQFSYDPELWNALSQEEKMAPAQEIPKEQPLRESPDKVVLEKTVHKISKFNLISLAVSFAALFIAMAYVHFVPSHASIEVATFMDEVDAKWAKSSFSPQNGDCLVSNEHFSLSKGIVQIQTQRGVRLMVEGPAEFEFTKEADFYLNYGRLYACVSPQGIGFTVTSANTKVIDMGTEFGILANKGGITELHVIKGKTTLVSGSSGISKLIENVTQSQARRISSDGTHVDVIPVLHEIFARDIESQTHTVWRGQRVNLADIVGGGNGLNTGSIGAAIDPLSGRQISGIKQEGRDSNGKYVRVQFNSPIDGIFVPNGKNGAVQITSSGLTFDGFRETCGRYWQELGNGGKQLFHDMTKPDYITLKGISYGTVQRPALFMHSNLGVTFDLQQVCRILPGYHASEFTALCGIPEHCGSGSYSLVDFLILVDGRCVFRRDKVPFDAEPIPVTIEIKPQDRFLTLVVTDGGNNHFEDEAVYALPYLKLTNE